MEIKYTNSSIQSIYFSKLCICDGAKSSCAAKIASAVDAGILGYYMHKNGQDFEEGDGLVADCAEQTIGNIGRLGKKGMKRTNEEIIKMMVGE